MRILTKMVGFFLLISASSWALLPPKYLSVPEWKSCVGNVSKGGAQFVCLPAKKPSHCPASSWSELLRLNELEYCSIQIQHSAIVLHALSKDQFIKVFVNKTSESIATDNLNGQTIANTFSMFLDGHGNIIGKMSHKPTNEPQMDKGIYSIEEDGTAYIIWQHWDGAKKLCFHAFDTENAYINVDCNNVFHTVFMKNSTQVGNQLES